MIRKYTYGAPLQTDAVTLDIPAENGLPSYGTISTQSGFTFTYTMADDDIVYGLGEANRGINKRGYCYISDCTIQTIPRISALFTGPTISLLYGENKLSACFLTILPA